MMNYSERIRLEDELMHLYHQKNHSFEFVDILPGELTWFDNYNSEDLGTMAEAGNSALGEIFAQIQADQMNLRRQCSMELEEIENDYRRHRRQIENQLDEL